MQLITAQSSPARALSALANWTRHGDIEEGQLYEIEQAVPAVPATEST